MIFAIGEVHEVPYPFVRETYTDHVPGGEDEWKEVEVPTWRPGTRAESGYDPHDGEWEDHTADAMGRMVLTIIGVYKPGKYPTRVFFTRQWMDPDGKTFGKAKLRIVAAGAFSALTKGYRHRFGVAKAA